MSATVDWRLAEQVDSAMRPALERAAREAVFALIRDDEPATTDADVMAEAIGQVGEAAGEYWAMLAAAAVDRDSEAIEDARMLIARMADVADVLLGHLSTGIEA